MELKKNPNIKEMKEVIYGIIEEEKKRYQIDINASPITIVEYYKTTILQKNLKLTTPVSTLVNLVAPINSLGWYNYKEKNIVIILNHYQEKENSTSLADLIRTGYHEARHRYQDQVTMKKNQYESFLMNIEHIILQSHLGYYYYKNNHDSFMLEIDANIDSIDKTIEYLKKYPEIYKEFQEYLEEKQKKYQNDYLVYNPRKIFEILNKLIKNNPDKILNKYSTLSMFYNSDGTFKSISTILNNSNLNSVDKRIINIVLSSEAFLNQLDLENLNENEREYMINILKNTYQEEIKRQQNEQSYSKNLKKLKLELLEKKGLLETVKYLNRTLNKLLYQPIEKKDTLKNKAYYGKIESMLSESVVENKRKRN